MRSTMPYIASPCKLSRITACWSNNSSKIFAAPRVSLHLTFFPRSTPPMYNASGYMPQGNDSSPNSKGRNQSAAAALIPCTCRQIKTAKLSSDEVFRIDGKEAQQVSIVGQITKVQDQSPTMAYEVSDGTDTLEVKIWLDTADPVLVERKAAWIEGAWIKVVGHMRTFSGQKHMMAFKITIVNDPAEITLHQLETLYVHLYNTQGPKAGGATDGMYDPASLQAKLLEVIRAYGTGDVNVSRDYLMQQFSGTTREQFDAAMQMLLAHGSIVEMDDNSWKASSSSA